MNLQVCANAMSDAPSAQTGDYRPIALSEIDASCRLPLFLMFVSAAVWLVIGSAFALISPLTFHQPAPSATCVLRSCGPAPPRCWLSFFFGFCLGGGLGVALFLILWLRRSGLVRRWVLCFGGMLWTLAAIGRLVSSFPGYGTSFE